MSVQILVVDKHGRAVKDAKVFVKWSGGGHSEATTNGGGVADLNCSAGRAEYVQVWGKNVPCAPELVDGANQVTLNYEV